MAIKITSYKTDNGNEDIKYDMSFKYDHSLYPIEIDSLSTSTDEFKDIFFINKIHETGILPPGVIALDKNIVIYECTPTTKLVQYTECARDYITSDTEYITASIPIPWQVYVVIFNNHYEVVETYMYYSKSSIIKNGYDQPVYLPALINFYSNGHLCRPFYASTTDTDFYPKDVSGVIASSYDAVWSSGWNSDLVDCLLNYSNDIRMFAYSESVAFKNYISEKYSSEIYADIIASTSMGFLNRDKNFSTFIKIIENYDIQDALNWCYAVPSLDPVREHELSNIAERASQEYHNNTFCEEEDCCEGEDSECSFNSDISEYIEEKRLEFWTFPRTLTDMLDNILYTQRNVLDHFDSVPRYDAGLFKLFFNKLIKYSNTSYTHHRYDEEPF